MGNTIKLTRLFSLSRSMSNHNIDYQVINGIQYKNDLQICAIFKYDYIDLNKKKFDENSEEKYILGLFKSGTREYIELPLEHKFIGEFESFELPLIKPTDDLYRELCIFLEINYSKHGPFSTKDFFKALHNAIPTIASEKNLDRRVCSYSYPTTKDNEQEKIYFDRFLPHGNNGKKRSLENKAKTHKLIPYANKVIGERNISVCFTDIPKSIEEEKIKMNSYNI
ncbi:TPA: hypothetical protein QCV70_005758 [Bacillus cereus]|uniref:DUF6037 family protein n=1 Tax=Bacillus TaxID=1386 RepID=UPI000BF36E63|nr:MULTISPECIES: DUF6037 family protein [Bacillus]MCR6850037.1 DUF6037 family protein [Bacillus sp. IBL03825]PFO46907.1 hypothetical protein COJ71_23750 [Bacillus cereus]PGK38669.1 hypothetical protein CN908_17030 [Bacillus thuringiensis]HDR6758750.1 hypothetical protein [Bacillus cereus]